MTPPSTRLISLVVPFYNESEGIRHFHQAVSPLLDSISGVRFEIVCIDDGSHDDTLAQLLDLHACDPRYRVVELSRNFGKEAALSAGLDVARGHAVIPLDADLQDPPELIPQMIDEWQRGVEIVLARRSDRSTDTFLKRKTATWFYRAHNRLSDVEIPENVGDFRLLDRAVVNALKALPERQRFMKGLFAWVGFKTASIDYSRPPRAAGHTKFSGWKLWNFALDGIVSFSAFPLKIWTYIGACGAVLTLLYAAFILVRTLISGNDVPGYPSLFVAVLFLGSLQLISIGVLGEYIGRIFAETKQRPLYIIRRLHG